MSCPHDNLTEVSKLIVRWGWTRQDDGTYEPNVEYDKVLDEEQVEAWTCDDCGETVFLDDDGRIKADDDH